MSEHVDQLQDKLEAAKEWPPPWIRAHYRDLELWRAFRESDRDTLKRRHPQWASDLPYIVDPLPERIAEVWPDLIYGDEPEITPAAEQDGDAVEGLVEANDLPAELQEAVGVCSSEGHVWWRVRVDEDAADFPLIDWLSGLSAIPLWRGKRPVAVAFHTVVEQNESQSETWRYVEIHGEGLVRSLLYKGTPDKLGTGQPLDAHDDTADLEEEWPHGLPILAGVIRNKLGKKVGRSDYAGVRDLLFALNETSQIGQGNARLTLRKRVVVPQRFLDKHGNFPVGADVIVATETDQNPDKPGQGLAQVEWEFDADAWVTWDGALTDKILTRCRVAPQLVGRNTEGAQTGPALRARLLDSTLAATGKARAWDETVPKIIALALQVYALSTDDGGFGGSVQSFDPPAIERSDVLPRDESDDVNRIAAEVGAEIKSRRTAIEERHPDWDEKRVDAELALIDGDTKLPQLTE